MENKGFTLIETVVVVAILAILAFFGVENIIEFQKNALLSSTAQEFTSALRRAQSMSITGEIPDDPKNPDNLKIKLPSDFDTNTNGLPRFWINLSPASYTIGYDYRLAGQTEDASYPLETFPIDPKLSISPTGKLTFTRLTGLTGSTTQFIVSSDVKHQIKVVVDDKGVITSKPL